jgi:hypothetical protein
MFLRIYGIKEKLALLEQQMAALMIQQHQLQVTLHSKVGRPKFFTIDPSEDFIQTVQRMNEHLYTSGTVPYSREEVLYTSLADFREDKTVFLADESFPYKKISVQTREEKRRGFWISLKGMTARISCIISAITSF